MVDIALLIQKLNVRFNGQLELIEGINAICTKREHLLHLLMILKEEYKFDRLADIAAVDYEDRYEMVYHLLNDTAELLAVKVKLDKNDCVVPSAASLWKAAEPQEREAYDLMGIAFEGHGNLKRILCPDDFVGHPLRKDFKLKVADRFQESPGKGGRLNVIDGR